MTGDRFEPYGLAETPGPGESEGRTEAWEQSGSWEQAESWDYDEARANPEAYDLLELRLMHDREPGPRFDRFQAAIADAPPVMVDPDAPTSLCPPADASWLDAARTGRFWASALWLVGAAGAGVLAGLVSTNFVALALNPAASSVLAEQLATPPASSRSALSAPASEAVTTLAQPAAWQAPGSEHAGPSTPAESLAPTPPEMAADEIASRTIQIAARQAAPATPPPAAPVTEVQVPAPAPAPAALQLAALVEPAPGLPATAPVTPIERPAPAAAPAAKVPADQADREQAPTPPPAASEARVTTPLALATSTAPTAEYRVQLAMLRDKQNVKYVWHDFVAQFGPSAKDLKRYVFPTQTAHGTRHLVQVGPFADEDHATAMCSQLKQRGGDCLVVHQPS
jgi:SPOR domain